MKNKVLKLIKYYYNNSKTTLTKKDINHFYNNYEEDIDKGTLLQFQLTDKNIEDVLEEYNDEEEFGDGIRVIFDLNKFNFDFKKV